MLNNLLRIACRLAHNFPAAFLREDSQIGIGVDSHRMISVFEQWNIHQCIAVCKIHALHVQPAEHLLDLALARYQVRSEANAAIDILHRCAYRLGAETPRKRFNPGLEDTAGNVNLCT